MKRVIVILSFISFLTNLTFIFETDSIADRFSFISTMFLSAVAYMFVITSYLPELRYLTLLDKYTFFTFGFIFLTGVENAVIKYETFGVDPDDLNLYVLAFNYVLWLIVHIIFVFWGYKAYSFEYQNQRKIK